MLDAGPLGAVAPVRAAARPALSRVARGWIVGGVVVVVLVLATVLYDNRLPVGSQGFWTILQTRLVAVATIAIVAFCHGVGTIVFHTATGNRILTPSILGFDALYRMMQTSLVFLLGAGSLVAADSLGAVALQTLVMVLFATLLYGWLFSGRRGDLHVLLLVGVVLGMGFGSVSTFMQRMLTRASSTSSRRGSSARSAGRAPSTCRGRAGSASPWVRSCGVVAGCSTSSRSVATSRRTSV